MLTNIIYVLATACLFTGTSMTYDNSETSDNFYLVGTSLFLIKSLICLIKDISKYLEKNLDDDEYEELIKTSEIYN